MPDSTLKQAIREAYAAAPANVVIYHTLEIRHPSFSTPIRVVRDVADLTATLESSAPLDAGTAVLWLGFAFDLVPPEVSAAGSPLMTIEIDNVSREILVNIEAAMSSPDLCKATYRAYLSSDLSGPQNDPPMHLTIFTIAVTPLRIRATAGFTDITNKRFPGEDYDAERFPGLIAQ